MKRLEDILQPIERAMSRYRRAQADPRLPEEVREGALLEAYLLHGAPFGAKDLSGMDLWGRYAQQTTRN